MRLLPLSLVALGLVASAPGLARTTRSAQSPGAPQGGPIRATLSAPTTTYTVSFTDPEGAPLTYAWTASISCGTFAPSTPDAASAQWTHPNGEGQGFCPHDGADHPGTITVDVSDGGYVVRCTYPGSLEGTGPPCAIVEDPGSSQQCDAEVSGGWLQPSQAVWQDDPFWPDAPGRQIQQIDTHEFATELEMIAGKPTLLFGTIRPAGLATHPDRRYTIAIQGVVTGTKKIPVRMQFSLDGVEFHTTEILAELPLDGPCGEPTPFDLRLPAPRGIPPRKTFTFNGPGRYEIENEILREDGIETELEVLVTGPVVETRQPVVEFYPVILSGASGATRAALVADAARLARQSKNFIPDYFPLKPQDFLSIRAALVDLQVARRRAAADYERWLAEGGLDVDETQLKLYRREAVLGEITRRLGLGIFLRLTTRNTDKAVLLLRNDDMNLLNPWSFDVGGLAVAPKLVYVRDDEKHSAVAHELAHTLPYVWLDDAQTPCGAPNYHNKSLNVANGFRVTTGGVEQRARRDRTRSFMEVHRRSDFWTDQCTYKNLVGQLQALNDPPVMLVQGRMARDPDEVIGELLPVYRNDGIIDLTEGTGGDYALVVRDETGSTLGRFPFEPGWTLATHPSIERNVLTFAYRLPDLPDAASVELAGPAGVLDTRPLTSAAPEVTITSPSDGQSVPRGAVMVEWEASDPDGDPLVFTVLHSLDGGRTFRTVAVEIDGPSTLVQLPSGRNHRVQVVATDGAVSVSDTVSFTVDR